jgi:hypothetical protein
LISLITVPIFVMVIIINRKFKKRKRFIWIYIVLRCLTW